MLRRILFGTTVLSASALLAQSAIADVTVDDVRAAYKAHMESLGAQVFETAETDGADTLMTGNALVFRAPLGVATMRVALPDYRMTPQSDGTVTLSYPETIAYQFEVDVPSQGAGTMAIEVTQAGYEGLASGVPGDVTFAQSAGDYSFEVSSLDGLEDFFDLSMVGQGSGYTISTRVEVSEMVTATTTSTNAPLEMAVAVTNPDGTVVTDTSQMGANASTLETSFPVGGSDIMNLSPVFAAGAFLRGTVDGEGGTSETITSIDGDVVSEEFQTTSQTTSRFSVDKDGFDLFGETGPAEFRFSVPEFLPFPIEGSVAGGVGSLIMPLMASEDAQDFGMRFDLQNLVMSEDVWALFDTTGDLPREPVSMNVDVSGAVISEIDAFDFAALEQQMNQSVPPISLESVTINEVSVSAIGATALATGAFTIDNADTATFDGFPRPEGSAILNVSGANALLDRLVSLGVLGADEAGMARLGMGFIARSTGDDAFETRLDVNAEGHVVVNGQRMR